MTRVISVFNQKGGVAKTTTAINLAAGLALASRKVLLIDLDPQADTTKGLGYKHSIEMPTIYDVLGNVEEVIPLSTVMVKTPVENLDLIPSSLSLSIGAYELISRDAREHILRRLLQPLLPLYDYVVIDCPPDLGIFAIIALTASTDILVPIAYDYFALEGVTDLLTTYHRVQKYLNPSLALSYVLLTMVDSTNIGKEIVEAVHRQFKNRVLKTQIRRNVKIKEAQAKGLPVFLYDPNCNGSIDYQAVVEEVLTYAEGQNSCR